MQGELPRCEFESTRPQAHTLISTLKPKSAFLVCVRQVFYERQNIENCVTLYATMSFARHSRPALEAHIGKPALKNAHWESDNRHRRSQKDI